MDDEGIRVSEYEDHLKIIDSLEDVKVREIFRFIFKVLVDINPGNE